MIRFSKPTENYAVNVGELSRFKNIKKCTLIISTNCGVITDNEAIKKNIGGLILVGVIY